MISFSSPSSALRAAMISEHPHYVLWMPVCLGFGIALYFLLPHEPNLWWAFGFSGACFLAWMVALYRRRLCYLSAGFFFVTFGFLYVALRAWLLFSPLPALPEHAVRIEARIAGMDLQPDGVRLILEEVRLLGGEESMLPGRVRITSKTALNGADIGDRIRVLAQLNPPKPAVVPGSYVFRRALYFEQIHATGFTLTPLLVVDYATSLSLSERMARYGNQLARTMMAHASHESVGALSAAFMLGTQGAVPRDLYDVMREAGLTHLIAVSGMNMVIVAGFFFFVVRVGFALFPSLALRIHTKKWAAFVALIGTFFYLLLVGSPVSAVRAFVMTSIILIAVMLDRVPTPLRCIAFAAFAILLYAPHSLLSAGFQMSFAATLALIVGFDALRTHAPHLIPEEHSSWLRRVLLYPVLVVISTLFASVATAPFTLFHFNQISILGVVANFFAVPLATLWITPWGILVLLLLPFSLEAWPMRFMEWGIEGMMAIAEFCSSLPASILMLPSISTLSFACFVGAGLWLCLWRTWIRLAALPFFCVGVVLAAWSHTTPDIFVNGKASLYALRDQHGAWFVSSLQRDRFARELMQQRLGMPTVLPVRDSQNSLCEESHCVATRKGRSILIVLSPDDPLPCYGAFDVAIDMREEGMRCRGSQISIGAQDIDVRGAHLVFLDEPISVQHGAHFEGQRLWSR